MSPAGPASPRMGDQMLTIFTPFGMQLVGLPLEHPHNLMMLPVSR
jgi:hypothetical protein